jgi:glycosyltransferase involved in cell wall biosynthesis
MRVLQFAPRLCWPLDTGAKLRNYHLARVLAGYASVSLLAFAESQPDKTELADVYEQVITAPRGQGYSFGNLWRGALGRTPLPLLNYTTDEMKHELLGTLNENDFNIIQIESIHLMNYLPVIRAARKRPLVICDWHNVESDLMRQYAEGQTNIARKTYARRTARLMSQHEQQALDEFDAHIVVSEHDAERLRRVNANAQMLVIENGVDVDYYKDFDSTTEKHRIVFVGSMDYHANIEGAVSFARNVWPSVYEKNPQLIFTIVGRDPAASVRELETIAGVEVTGSVEDVRPSYREAILAVVPLNVGGGSRLKILEAMAAGVPVASTARGAEGLQVTNGENILLADSNDELAGVIISLLGEPDLRAQIISGGRELATNRYDWSKLGSKLFEYYGELVQEQLVKPQP